VSVRVSVPCRIPTLLHGPGCNFGNGRGCPLVVHYRADLQSVHALRCYDNIAPNAKYQRVLVLALCLVTVCSTLKCFSTQMCCNYRAGESLLLLTAGAAGGGTE